MNFIMSFSNTISDSIEDNTSINKKEITDKKNSYVFDNGAVYTGPLLRKLPNGSGRTVFKNGDIYEGDYVKGIRNGHGIYTFADGEKYEGEWLDNRQQIGRA